MIPFRLKWGSSRILISAGALVVTCCIIVTYIVFYSPEAVLRRELTAYSQSLSAGDPQPELVPHLSSESVPLLLDWLATTNLEPNASERFYHLLWVLMDRAGLDDRLEMPSTIQNYPPQLAVTGFEFLGTNAAAALPELEELARSEFASARPEIFSAIIAIGEPSLNLAATFCSDSSPAIRAQGAFLIAGLRRERARSISVLVPLLDDPNPNVRFEAYSALAQFPGQDLERLIIERFRTLDHSQDPTVCYVLHTGSTNALLQLVEISIAATNREARIAVLATLAARDRRWEYESLRSMISFVVERHPSTDALQLVSSNIIRFGEPRIIETFRSLDPDLHAKDPQP